MHLNKIILISKKFGLIEINFKLYIYLGNFLINTFYNLKVHPKISINVI